MKKENTAALRGPMDMYTLQLPCGWLNATRAGNRMMKESKKFFRDINNCEREISYAFKVGEKYTRVEIKNILSRIFKKVGVQLSPKATNLKYFFEIKPVIIGKRGGFKILQKK